MKIHSFLLFFVSLLFTSCLSILPEQQAACMDLFNSFGQPALSGWGTSDCCTWVDIMCEATHTSVTQINLSQSSFTGTIPSSIGSFTQLQRLDLYKNQLHGSLPDSLCDLTNTTFFGLGSNQFVGTIPSCLGNLKQLQYFDVCSNRLNVLIPSSFSNLTSLSYLWLNDNQFISPIPGFLQIAPTYAISLKNNSFCCPLYAWVAGQGVQCNNCGSTTSSPNGNEQFSTTTAGGYSATTGSPKASTTGIIQGSTTSDSSPIFTPSDIQPFTTAFTDQNQTKVNIFTIENFMITIQSTANNNGGDYFFSSSAFNITINNQANTVFSQPVSIRFYPGSFDSQILSDLSNVCLGFKGDNVDDDWACEDNNLLMNQDSSVTGFTTHFTSFSILVSNSKTDQPKGSNGNTNANYNSKSSLSTLNIIVISSACAVVVIAVIVLIFVKTKKILNSTRMEDETI
eukprot:TRINITY_DN16955_c0_g1_i1.p1 TRINITY_DN16955_c0_g1~~TRINITY_DN16955_c0_g1_i1.p1  ORF type:complete len:454 (-),score=74.43 TRINITY_DN16955_c0_g1_i1:93-1454(-)